MIAITYKKTKKKAYVCQGEYLSDGFISEKRLVKSLRGITDIDREEGQMMQKTKMLTEGRGC